MGHISVLLLVSLAGLFLVYGFPVKSTPVTYPQGDARIQEGEWSNGQVIFLAVSALALVCTAAGLLFGCTWCYRHKDCKPNEGPEHQLFTTSATHLTDATSRRSQPPDTDNANNNISEDNNNGPISLREMQNIANNNATAYIISENEERNRTASRESVVQFEPLPAGIGGVNDPLAPHAAWFVRPRDEVPRNRLQYLREIDRGWFGRIVEGEIESDELDGQSTFVAVKILDQNSTPTNKARFLSEARLYKDINHENILPLVNYSLEEEPWIMMYEFCPMDLQQYLITNRPKMAILNESGVTLRLQCDIAAGLTYLHAQNLLFGDVWSGNISIRGSLESARALLGRPSCVPPPPLYITEEPHTVKSEVFALGIVLWEVCSWGASPPRVPSPAPALPCPYRSHLYQVMQLCWSTEPESRPTASQVYDLLNHLLISHQQSNDISSESATDFEDRWQRLKPNSIPKLDEHVAIIHAPSISNTSQFTDSQDLDNNPQSINDTLSISLNAASRSSSLMSDKDPLSIQIKSDSLTNLHGSFEDVRNIYLNHSEQTIMECQQENIQDLDSSDSSDLKVDPWLKDIIAGSQDDVSYYRDVSDVIKNLDNILNSEKTSSSGSSHQASPSRDNLTLDCKKDYPIQSCLVKSPGITNFQNILNMSPEHKPKELSDEEEVERVKIEPLNHSFERHSDTNSVNTLENVTPETPNIDFKCFVEDSVIQNKDNSEIKPIDNEKVEESESLTLKPAEIVLDNKNIEVAKNNKEDIPRLMELCLATVNLNKNSVSELEESIKCESTVTEKTLQDLTETVHEDNYINKEKDENLSISLKDQSKIENTTKPLIMSEVSDNSTVYMDLINDTGSELINKNINVDLNVKDIVETFAISNSGLDTSKIVNESTIYLDLPAVINETHNLLNSERLYSEQDCNANDKIITTSTPKESDVSSIDDNLENSKLLKEETSVIEEPDYGPGITVTKLEQKIASEIFSPFESPTKSHPTDTFDENSSVVLGPFENCTLDLFKGVKTNEFLDIPKDELLSFSTNDIVLETPSPLRDSNFLNEVPDIVTNDSSQSLSPIKPPNIDIKSTMENLDLPPLSPTTPPNSPGNFLTTSPQHKYVIENIGDPLHDDLPDPIMDLEDDLNQIELQISTKIAIAENENNMNLEYSGPLDIEQIERFPDIIEIGGGAEMLVGGNGEYFGGDNEERDALEHSMQALRDELELKLPLAQSVNIEPPAENDGWSGDFPMPPEMILNYAGALSPIMEETGHQLSAYENDRPWLSLRTESSESYPEPCTADDVTELMTGVRDDTTYTLKSDHLTYTVQKDDASSKLITMTADSLNVIPPDNKPAPSPSDTETKKDDNIERISQVSPFILSPTTESNPHNESEISALTKTSIPTDAKSSKPSETQCLSKATSIDSWCSNDTLFNVEDNFDDLAMDPDLPSTFKAEDDHSQSTETLTHHDDNEELSHCSTYIVHDTKSDSCSNTMPDSAGHRTYNVPKDETDDKNSPSIGTKSEINDSTKNTQTKDLAYGTLQSGTNSYLATYSNCTTEAFSEPWKGYPPPEMVRRSPVNEGVGFSPPQNNYDNKFDSPEELPQINSNKQLKKVESFDLECLNDHSIENVDSKDSVSHNVPVVCLNNISDAHFEDLPSTAQSTPLVEAVDNDSGETITLEFPQNSDVNKSILTTIPNFVTFYQSVELRPQDISSVESSMNATSTNTDLLLEGDSQIMSYSQGTPTYAVFQDSVVMKPQEVHSAVSSQHLNSDMNSIQDFLQFQNSVRSRPQDLSDIESTSLLLRNEILSSESQLLSTFDIKPLDIENQISSISVVANVVAEDIRPNNINNAIKESQGRNKLETINPINTDNLKINNDTFNSHNDEFSTFDSHAGQSKIPQNDSTNESNTKSSDPKSPVFNGDMDDIGKQNEAPIASPPNSSDKLEDFSKPDEKEHGTDNNEVNKEVKKKIPNKNLEHSENNIKDEKFATENFISEAFEELIESNVDDVNASQEIIDNIKPSPDKTESPKKYDTEIIETILNATLNDEVHNAVNNENCNVVKIEDHNTLNNEDHKAVKNEDHKVEINEDHNAVNNEDNNVIKNEEHNTENKEHPNTKKNEDNIALNTDHHNAVNNEHCNSVKIEDHNTVNNEDHNAVNNEHHNVEKNEDHTTLSNEVPNSVNIEDHNSLNNENLNAVNTENRNAVHNEDLSKFKIENQTNVNNDDHITENNEEHNTVNNEDFNAVKNEHHDVKNEDHEAVNNEVHNSLNSEDHNEIIPALSTATADFIVKEKHFCQLDKYLPLLSDIRFTGPADDCMSTSFTQPSPTDETNPMVRETRTNNIPTAADLLKEWDSDSDDSTSSNSSSGEFIWKGGDGREARLQSNTDFTHQGTNGSPPRGGPSNSNATGYGPGASGSRSANSGSGSANSGSADSGSGSDGDELEFVPSSWDCRAEPSKSSLRTTEQAQTDNKKRVVFKRQKYHCVYEYPREAPHLAPDYSTYTEWDAASAEEAELGYGQLFGSHPLDLFSIQAGVSFGGDYEEDFFISSSARPFESLGIMPTSSQFFPGMHGLKQPYPSLPDNLTPVQPQITPTQPQITPIQPQTLDFTTPDSGVEDITPMISEDDYKNKLPTDLTCWNKIDSGSSSESVSPSSPASEALGGLRHTRDKLKLDLPPSPHLPSPRHNKVFNFSLDKPKIKRMHSEDKTPLVMTDETPVITTNLPLESTDEFVIPEPTFSTFGKDISKSINTEQPIILNEPIIIEEVETKELEPSVEENKVESLTEKKEGNSDSGDEDSGIESSSKATLERINSATKIT